METLELPLVMPTPPSAHGFRLHPALDASLYHMPGSLRNIRKWRAYCYVGNDCSDDTKVGALQEVGYVMMSLRDDTVIPIARGDEHHRGYDLLYDFASGEYETYRTGRRRRKGAGLNISPADYVPVWSHGTNYVYGPKDAPDMVAALAKWLKWGGCDGILWGANDLRGSAMSSSEAVRRNGDFTIEPGHLASIGADIHARLRQISEAVVKLGRNPDRQAMSDVFAQTSNLLKRLKPFSYYVGLSSEWSDEAGRRLYQARKQADSQLLWELVFGYNGLKNMLHIYLREETEKDSMWSRDHLKAIWGDPGLAIDMLGRL